MLMHVLNSLFKSPVAKLKFRVFILYIYTLIHRPSVRKEELESGEYSTTSHYGLYSTLGVSQINQHP